MSVDQVTRSPALKMPPPSSGLRLFDTSERVSTRSPRLRIPPPATLVRLPVTRTRIALSEPTFWTPPPPPVAELPLRMITSVSVTVACGSIVSGRTVPPPLSTGRSGPGADPANVRSLVTSVLPVQVPEITSRSPAVAASTAACSEPNAAEPLVTRQAAAPAGVATTPTAAAAVPATTRALSARLIANPRE
jgi:hypothetical protein